MNKILLIGSCGAGKSTLAKKISESLNLPLISLDQRYWRPGWTRSEAEEWRAKVKELVQGEKWVIDGNYQSTFEIRVVACDTIIYLDINRFICFWRIWKRRFLKNRVDKLDSCDEKIDFKLIKWVLWGFPTRGKKRIKYYLSKFNDKNVIVVKNQRDIDCLISNI